MSAALALARARWRTAVSYRVAMALSLGGLLVSVVPVYFVAEALQPTMAPVIAGEGDHYFAFLVTGMVVLALLVPAVSGMPRAIRKSIETGTLEALFGTPASPGTIVAGLAGYDFAWAALHGLLLFGAAVALGAAFVPARVPVALAILGLTVAAHVPIGMMAGASVLAFRTVGPLPQVVLSGSALLGGVYYPTHVIPSWIQELSHLFPLTYGLRALRGVLLEGAPVGAVAGDVGILLALAGALATGGVLALRTGLRAARRNGNLAVY